VALIIRSRQVQVQNRKACLPRTMAVCCLHPRACIGPVNAGVVLSVCHAVWWGLRTHAAPGKTLQAERPVHICLACFHVWPALRCADPKILVRVSPHYREYTVLLYTKKYYFQVF